MERYYLKSFSIHLKIFIQGSLFSQTSSPHLILLSKEKSFLKFQFINSGWLHLLWYDYQEMLLGRLQVLPEHTPIIKTSHSPNPQPQLTRQKEDRTKMLSSIPVKWTEGLSVGNVTVYAETNVYSEQTEMSRTESSVVSCLFWQRRNEIGN